MTQKEMVDIFAVLLLAFPNAETFKGGIQKLGPTIELWTACLPDVDYWIGQQAAIKLCRECKYPPTIAEFREKADAVKNEVGNQISQAWESLRLPMKLRGASPVEAYINAPDMTRAAVDAMGGADKLVINGIFNYDGFRKAYEKLLRGRSESRSAIGNSTPRQIGGKSK